MPRGINTTAVLLSSSLNEFFDHPRILQRTSNPKTCTHCTSFLTGQCWRHLEEYLLPWIVGRSLRCTCMENAGKPRTT